MKRSRQTIRTLLELLDMKAVAFITMDAVTFSTFIQFINLHGIEDRYEYYFKNNKAHVSLKPVEVEDANGKEDD